MKKIWLVLLCLAGVLLFTDSDSVPFILPLVFAHCDTLDGPVVKTARAALEKGDITPVLKWIMREDENEIQDLFKKTLIVRSKGREAREIADRYFLETLVRLHRAGEGEPYTGLKPAGVVEPAVAEADKALEGGSDDQLIKLVTEATAKGIHERFNKARDAKRRANDNVEAGREYVHAYVQFTHYVERLHLDSTMTPEHQHGRHHATPVDDPHDH